MAYVTMNDDPLKSVSKWTAPTATALPQPPSTTATGTATTTKPLTETLPKAPTTLGTPVPLNQSMPVTLPAPPTGSNVPVASNVPGATVAPFGPGQDMRYQSVLPTGTDRVGLAQQYFDQFAESTNPAYEQTLRAATQRAAANGTLGSGMLTNTYGDVASQRAQSLDLARRGFLTDALQGSIADQVGNRNELRQERDYQSGVSNNAIAQEIQRLLVEDQLGGNNFNRQLDLARTLGGLGYAGNPDSTLLGAAGNYQNSANQTYDLLGQILGSLGQRSAGG